MLAGPGTRSHSLIACRFPARLKIWFSFCGRDLGNMIRQLHREALIKAQYFASHGMNWLAAISNLGLSGFLKRSFLEGDKFPRFRLWNRKRFASHLTDILLQETEDLKEFFDGRHVERMVRTHLPGRKNYLDEIDKLMTGTLAHNILLKRRHIRDWPY